MGGSVHYHAPAKRWFIQIYVNKKPIRLWKDCDYFEPFITKKRALKYLSIAQRQIDENDFALKYWQPESPVSIRIYSQNWLEDKKVDARTLRGYRTDIKRYVIPFFQDADIRTIKAKQIRQFMAWLEKQGLAQDTVHHKMSTLKTMFRDAYRDEDIRRVPPFPILSRKQLTRPDSLTLEEQERLIQAIPERHRPIFQIGMEFGLRVGEARAIQKDCVKDGYLTIKRAFSDNRLKDTKTGLVREYELTLYAKEMFNIAQSILHISRFIFTREDGKPYTNKNLNEIWKLACKKTEIQIKLQNAFRHSLGCQLVDMGCDMQHVADQLGHTDIRTTKRYAVRSKETLTKALEDRRAKVIPIVGEK